MNRLAFVWSVLLAWVVLAVALPMASAQDFDGERGEADSPPPATVEQAEAEKQAAIIRYWDVREVFRRGGFLMWPILFCSITTLTFGLERWVKLRRERVVAPRFAHRFIDQLEQGDMDRHQALALCRSTDLPVAKVFLAAVRHWGRPTVELEQAVSEAGGQQVGLLKRNLRALQASANLAVLLGLLGTVIGMIEAFNEVARSPGMPQAGQLATGIAAALLTTAGGLTVAIPSLLLHAYFANRIEKLVYEVDELAGTVVDLVSAETLARLAVRTSGSAGGAGPAKPIASPPTTAAPRSSAPAQRIRRAAGPPSASEGRPRPATPEEGR